MKIMKHTCADFERLVRTAGCDPNREHLQAVYFDQKHKFAVATDGHRLFASRALWQERPKGQEAVKVAPFAAGLEHVPVVMGFPSVGPLIESNFTQHKFVADIKIPKWLEVLKSKGDKVRVPITISLRGVGDVAAKSLDIREGEVAPAGVFQLNAALIAPFAGETIRIGFTDPTTGVAIVPHSIGRIDNAWENPWFAIVMPMRGGSDGFQVVSILASEHVTTGLWSSNSKSATQPPKVEAPLQKRQIPDEPDWVRVPDPAYTPSHALPIESTAERRLAKTPPPAAPQQREIPEEGPKIITRKEMKREARSAVIAKEKRSRLLARIKEARG